MCAFRSVKTKYKKQLHGSAESAAGSYAALQHPQCWGDKLPAWSNNGPLAPDVHSPLTRCITGKKVFEFICSKGVFLTTCVN